MSTLLWIILGLIVCTLFLATQEPRLISVLLGGVSELKSPEADQFISEKDAGKKIRFSDWGAQKWHIGPPFVPYGPMIDQKGTPPSTYCLAEYDEEGQLITLSNIINGKEQWKQTIAYRKGRKKLVTFKDANGDITEILSYVDGKAHSIKNEILETAKIELVNKKPDYVEKLKSYKVIVGEDDPHLVVTFDDPDRDPQSLGNSGTSLPTFHVVIDPIDKKVVKSYFAR